LVLGLGEAASVGDLDRVELRARRDVVDREGELATLLRLLADAQVPWFADWSGELSDSDVYIGLMGGAPTAPSVRLLLDDWEFEDVADGDVGELLRGIFSGEATIRRRRSFPFSSVRVLECAVGSARCSAAKRSGPDEEPQPWERSRAR
jgi:hypothetical protein